MPPGLSSMGHRACSGNQSRRKHVCPTIYLAEHLHLHTGNKNAALHFLTDPRGTKATTNLSPSPCQLHGSYHISKRYTLGVRAGLELLNMMLGRYKEKKTLWLHSQFEDWSVSSLKPLIIMHTVHTRTNGKGAHEMSSEHPSTHRYQPSVTQQ